MIRAVFHSAFRFVCEVSLKMLLNLHSDHSKTKILARCVHGYPRSRKILEMRRLSPHWLAGSQAAWFTSGPRPTQKNAKTLNRARFSSRNTIQKPRALLNFLCYPGLQTSRHFGFQPASEASNCPGSTASQASS